MEYLSPLLAALLRLGRRPRPERVHPGGEPGERAQLPGHHQAHAGADRVRGRGGGPAGAGKVPGRLHQEQLRQDLGHEQEGAKVRFVKYMLFGKAT